MENYHLITVTDRELVYLPVLLKRTSSAKRHPDFLVYIPAVPTWFIDAQEPVISEEA